MVQTTLPLIQIRMLGTCSITVQDYSLRATDSHSKKLWILFCYMALYRSREIHLTEYIDLLWDKQKSNNPSSALKTLMHRLRKLLEPLNYPIPIILPHHGTYAFNQAIPCNIDVEEFTKQCKESDNWKETEEYELKMRQALILYQGEFIPDGRENNWVSSLNAQYHALYLHAIQAMLDQLICNERYAQAANLCWQALTYAPYEENLHYFLIYSLHLSGSQQAAIVQYNTSRDLFLSRLSKYPSKKFEELYKLITASRNNIETDIELIQESLTEHNPKGTFFCEYEIFKELYRLETRIVKRTQSTIFLCLITITDASNQSYEMLYLKNAILNSLRGCDIFTRYSSSQYLLLIPAPNAELITQIINRIMEHYYSNKANGTIEYAVRQLQG
ncbi:MAG: hypothetical protein HFG39_13640 [Lachnospiraceae bacterium]|nr:hypothetical protein [Lachnospiraceae bacterium]